MSGPAVEIRRSTLEDVDGLWQCIDAVARERRFIGMVEAPPLADARSFIEQARANGMIQLVAVDRARILGWCDITPLRWEGFRHSGRLGMGVLAGFRGRGLGTRLLVAALRAAEESGLTRIELEVFASNHAAVRLYERHGFIVEGVKRGARVLDGMVDDLVCMARVDHDALRNAQLVR